MTLRASQLCLRIWYRRLYHKTLVMHRQNHEVQYLNLPRCLPWGNEGHWLTQLNWDNSDFHALHWINSDFLVSSLQPLLKKILNLKIFALIVNGVSNPMGSKILETMLKNLTMFQNHQHWERSAERWISSSLMSYCSRFPMPWLLILAEINGLNMSERSHVLQQLLNKRMHYNGTIDIATI